MAPDRRLVVRVQAEVVVGGLEGPAFSFIDSPILARRPALFLVRMTVDGPRAKHRIEYVVHLRKDTRTADVRVVLRPADNHRVQALNQRALFRVSMAVDNPAEVLTMSLDGGFAGGDTRREAMQTASAILT
jgi:hypothetical protein